MAIETDGASRSHETAPFEDCLADRTLARHDHGACIEWFRVAHRGTRLRFGLEFSRLTDRAPSTPRAGAAPLTVAHEAEVAA